jgi:N6-adenosine-specific RNA methylase IME4
VTSEFPTAETWPFGNHFPGEFDFIMADPPWTFKTYSDKGLKKSAQAQYDCMSIEGIRALPVSHLVKPNAIIWLWATWPMLPEALQTMHAWGFQYKTGGVWAKRTKTGKLRWGTGFRLRSVCEPFLIGARGQPKSSRAVCNMVDGLAREHSRKPDAAFLAAEKMMPDAKRLELFSREKRVGWDNWGNESEKYGG